MRKDTPTVEMRQKKILQRRGPSLRFTGALIADTEFETTQGFTMRFEIWETQGGNYIAASITEMETRAAVIEKGDGFQMK